MRIEKINDNKIRVMINGAEAKAWNISFKSISENTPQAQEMFWEAIRLAERKVDFSVNGAKLFVEAVKPTEGEEDGFGMLITRVCSDAELKEAVDNCSYHGKLKRTSLKRETAQVQKHIYRFRDFETVCAAADEIRGLYQGQSVLYQYDGSFYLYLVPDKACAFAETEAVLSEFGACVSNTLYMHGRLNEYGEKMIVENAVEVMQEYFCVH